MRDDVAAVIAMHVHSNTGVVAPVAAICALARQRGIVSIIDVAQSTCIMPVDPIVWGADALVGSCLKWLCGGPAPAGVGQP
ncbi:MAG: aminotransferase class V-fold PLP-dependent enzyme [Asticcacaulis sp.]